MENIQEYNVGKIYIVISKGHVIVGDRCTDQQTFV